MTLTAEIVWTTRNPCACCEHLEYCRAILWQDKPLPCMERKIEMKQILCQLCGEIFTPRVSYQKYCCDMCYEKARKERARAAYILKKQADAQC